MNDVEKERRDRCALLARSQAVFDLDKRLYRLIGPKAVLLPIERGVKFPRTNGWQKTTLEATQREQYRHRLVLACQRGGNIGVLLGPPSSGLVTIDIDDDAEVERFLELNPKLRESLRTRGQKGCQIWLQMTGDYPARWIGSGKKRPGQPNASMAEWRAGSGHQSILYGIHDKTRAPYKRLVDAPPLETVFTDIKWPEDWGMIFDGNSAKETQQSAGAASRATAGELSPERAKRIWRYVDKVDLAVEGEGGSNPTYRLANVLVWDFALSVEQAKPFMTMYSMTKCIPPWPESLIDHKLKDAMKADHGDRPRGRLLAEKERSGAAAKPDSEYSAQEVLKALGEAAIKGSAFRELKIPSREKLLDDWFREGDTGFIYSHRGVGKTWLAWAIARAIAAGESVGPWEAGEKAVSVCYVDGEMPAELMQGRDRAFGEACENLTLINHEILFERTGHVLNLAKPEVQQAITQWCVEGGFKVLVVDNLSTLASGVKENDADAWELLLPWLLDLRRKKVSVLLVHHAGRSGEMRGTSRREDSVFWIIKLERESDYTDQGCSFLVRFEKNRNSAHNPDSHIWTIKPIDPLSDKVEITHRVASFQDLVLDLIRDDVTRCNVIAKELDCAPATVSKAAKKLEADGKIIRTNARTYQAVGDSTSPIGKELFERAAEMAKENERKCPDCAKNPIRQKQRYCDECRDVRRKKSDAAAQRKRRENR